MKNYTIIAKADLMPVAYITEDDFDYYFTANAEHATHYSEDDIDEQLEIFGVYHPEYIFTKTEVVSK